MVYETIGYTKWFSFCMLLVILAILGPIQTTASTQHDSIPIHVYASDKELHSQASLSSAKEKVVSEQPFAYMHQDPSQFAAVEVVATGYTAGPESTGKSPGHPQYGITYSGVKVRKSGVSTIAADPSIFPLGTIMFIPGYGYGVVADTGSAIKGHKLDLYYETEEDVYEYWGKKVVKVHVIQVGTGTVTEQVLDNLNEAYSTNNKQPTVM